MTGLDKIIKQIQLDSDNTCNSILDKNREECNRIMNKAEAEADLIRENGLSAADERYKNIIARAYSTSEIEERRIILQSKQKIVSDMTNNALQNMINLPDDNYFDVVYKLIEKYSLVGDGVIMFNSRDYSRLPSDFSAKANSVSKGKILLGESAVDIDGGFVLVYGGIDVNCSFNSLFYDNSEKISDQVAQLLFSEV